jgi:hypothetical protein
MRRSPAKRFLFRLAVALGREHPYRMARRIPAWLIAEWEAYAALEPFGELRADYRSAQIVAMLYNLNRDPKKDPDGKGTHEFLIPWDAEEKTDEQRQKEHEGKMRVTQLILRAQAEAAAESRAVAPPRVTEFHYPQPGDDPDPIPVVAPPLVVDDHIAAMLARARAAMKDV